MTEKELKAIAEKYETPSFVFDIEALHDRMKKVKEIVGTNIHVCYSMKANPFLVPAMLEVVEKLEVCSPGELSICEHLGVDAERIIYSGVSKTIANIEQAVQDEVGLYTAESLQQLDRLNQCGMQVGRVLPVILRLTAGTQFGMSKEDLCDAIAHRESYPGVKIAGIHYFAGTQRKKLDRQREELQMLAELLQELKTAYGFVAEKLEYGPGLPVPYFDGEDFADTLKPLKELSPDLQRIADMVELTVEMGRFYTTECGYYLTKVLETKSGHEVNYAIMDGGMNHMNYLGQMMGMKVPLITHMKMDDCGDAEAGECIQSVKEYSGRQTNCTEKTKEWCLCGSLCTTSDVMVRKVEFEELEVGDVLVFKNIGAYSVTEGIYLFLSRTMPRILLWYSEGQVEMVRDFVESSNFNRKRIEENVI